MDVFKDGLVSDLADVLASRELRVTRQKALAETESPVIISFQLNIPGPVKTSPLLVDLFDDGVAAIVTVLEDLTLSMTSLRKYYQKTGPECLIACAGDSRILKQEMIKLEDSSYGRLFDIDILKVVDKELISLSREELGFSQRSCLLCNDSAKACGRSRKHTLSELQEEISQLINRI